MKNVFGIKIRALTLVEFEMSMLHQADGVISCLYRCYRGLSCILTQLSIVVIVAVGVDTTRYTVQGIAESRNLLEENLAEESTGHWVRRVRRRTHLAGSSISGLYMLTVFPGYLQFVFLVKNAKINAKCPTIISCFRV